MNKIQIKSILTDIRFWLVIFFILRLVGITNAPLEIGHNWRQSLTNMIARNFLENGANILYPMIDMAGEKSAIIGSEFPFFNYLIYLFSYLFDSSHWYGRLINLVFSSLGLYFFYKLVKQLLDKRTAFNATIVLTTSIWFAFSRKIMPDTFSIAFLITGLYYAYSFLKNGYKSSLLLFFILCTLGMLCKIPALSLFSVIAIVIFLKEISVHRRIVICSAAVLSFSIVCLWYFYWVPYLLKTYHYQLYFTKGISEGLREIIPLFPELLEKFYFSSLHSYIAFICFIIGLFLFIKNENKLKKFSIGIITFVFVLFIIKTGSVFPLHSYYIIPFTPVMALLVGYFIKQIPLKFQYILLGLIAIEGIVNQQHDFFIKESQVYKLKLEKKVEKFIAREDLIVINGGQSPQDIYFSHRKGWTVDNVLIMTPCYLDSLTDLGAKYLIVDMSHFDQKFIQYESIYSDNHYSIYKLKKVANKK
jgi:4-amino-4-deoxy-L-arabinose transferase-like glycosyltransferase